jgi:hypothetical protein
MGVTLLGTVVLSSGGRRWGDRRSPPDSSVAGHSSWGLVLIGARLVSRIDRRNVT